MSLEDAEDVAPARSPRSTRSTDRPRPAASRAIPTPLIPPPTTNRSSGGPPFPGTASLDQDMSGNRGNLPLQEQGHGIVAQGQWYFLPADLPGVSIDAVQRYGISVDKLQAYLSRTGALRVAVIIDACYSGSAVESISRSVASDASTRSAVVPVKNGCGGGA